jgi:hypothetical protein
MLGLVCGFSTLILGEKMPVQSIELEEVPMLNELTDEQLEATVDTGSLPTALPCLTARL